MQLDLIYLIIGLFVGLAIGWLLANQKSVAKINRLEATIEVREESFQESKNLLKSEMKNIAVDVNRESSETLLQLAGERFDAQKKEVENNLEAKKKEVNDLVEPIKEQLEKLRTETNKIEKDREGAYMGLKRQIEGLSKQATDLRDTNVQLSTALRGSIKTRGQWGQVSLKNIAKAAGMVEHCDFDVEHTLLSGKGGARVDMIARIPGGGDIPVDAKVPLAAYWDALEIEDPHARMEKMSEHAKHVKRHIDDLNLRDYPSLMEGSDFTVMFIPAEPILSSAYEIEPTLQEYAFSKQVIIATPVTLIALLRTVGIYWQQQSIAENAKEIHSVALEFYERVSVFGGHLNKVGRGLTTAIGAYNESIGSFNSRIMPSGRRLEQLKVAESTTKNLEKATPVDISSRLIENIKTEEE